MKDFYLDCINTLKQSVVLDSNLEPFSVDRSPGLSEMPSIVVIPESVTDVQACLKCASFHKFPVTVRGAGSGTTGGALPVHNGCVLSLEKLNRVLEFDLENKMVVCEPGVITGHIIKEAEKHRLFYPPDPQSLEYCTIGGNVAENAGGPRALKYGVTGDYVIGLKGFYMDGTPFSYGGKQLKNVAGFDLMRLLIGSEGTLAIITEITLKLRSLPKYRSLFTVLFDSYDKAVKGLNEIHQNHLEPSMVEFIDGRCFDAAASYLSLSNPYPNIPALLMIELDGSSSKQVLDEQARVKELMQSLGAIQFDDLSTGKDDVVSLRQHTSLGLTTMYLNKKSEDVVVPPKNIPAYLSFLQDCGRSYGLTILGYGHLGDGNIHVNILNESLSEQDWLNASKEVIQLS